MDATSENPSCRICLDSSETEKNPLISPCACKGSIEQVHLKCLNRWRGQNTETNMETCRLCLIPYKIPEEYDIEAIPSGTLTVFILDNMILINIVFHFFMIAYNITGHQLIPYELAIHFIQIYLIYTTFRVRKRKEYIKCIYTGKHYLLLVIYILLLATNLRTNANESIVYLMASTININLYWTNHIIILHTMNQEQMNENENE